MNFLNNALETDDISIETYVYQVLVRIKKVLHYLSPKFQVPQTVLNLWTTENYTCSTFLIANQCLLKLEK